MRNKHRRIDSFNAWKAWNGTAPSNFACQTRSLLQTVDEAIENFVSITSLVYSSKPKLGKAALDHHVFEEQMKGLIAQYTHDSETILAHPSIDGCKTFVVAVDSRSRTPVLMRTYHTPHNDAFPGTIWQAARATSAKPALFQPIIIDDVSYIDGGVGWRNPAELALDETHRIWSNPTIGCLVTIGTGLEAPIQIEDGWDIAGIFRWLLPTTFSILQVLQYTTALVTSCETVHRQLFQKQDRLGIGGRYFRFNAPVDMSDIENEAVIELTIDYMESPELRAPCIRTVRALLDTRTLNEYDWTTGSDYRITHKRKIDVGAFGEVHQVCSLQVI
jgi:predicted acylesterase/phospholipase RssA